MDLLICFKLPDGGEQTCRLKPPGGRLGRSEDMAVVLDDASVSSGHARLACDPDGDWWLEDLGSTNGTWIGEEEVSGCVPVRDGLRVTFGTVDAMLELVEAASETQPPEPAPEQKPVEEPEVVAAEPERPSPAMSGETEPGSEQVRAAKTEKPRKEKRPKKVREKKPLLKGKWGQPEFYTECFFAVCAFVHGLFAVFLPKLIGVFVRAQNRIPLRVRFASGFAMLALISVWVGWEALPSYWEWTSFSEEHLEILSDRGMIDQGGRVETLGRFTAWAMLVVGVAALLRHQAVLWLFKAGLALFFLQWLTLHNFYTRVPALLNDVDYQQFSNEMRNEYWLRGWMPWLTALLPALLLSLGTALRSVRNFYAGEKTAEPLSGDRVVESLRTGGRDPRMRSSSYWATFMTVFLLALPFLMRGCGWEEPYGLVKGSGDPVVEMVRVTRQREIPERRLIVSNWSPFIFERMRIDDIQILEELEEQTLDTYEIAQEQTGRLGEGGGDTGGWPEGMEGATVRFIRLQYRGGDWDQNMDRNSDRNLLRRFNQITGFPVATDGEGLRVERLRRFPDGLKPPFVFMTGAGNVQFSANEIRTLRWYTLEEGGMIFATHGGGNFDRNFRNQLNRIFPGARLVDIPNDDPIYRAPFVFPNGAPPLWQQAGSRSLGIRHEGRWVVFYHPGDMSDAWRDGHNDAPPQVAEQAYRMAINVMYYAFNQYYARHHH